jgi:hypothetical protein
MITSARRFRSLSARLTVQFALLFAVAMLGVSAALSTFIAGAASHQVESQLQSSGAVYDRLWQQRQRELQSAAHDVRLRRGAASSRARARVDRAWPNRNWRRDGRYLDQWSHDAG